MSGEERLRIVIDAENQGSDEVEGFAKSVKAADEAAEASKGAFGGMVTSLTDVKAGFDLASQGLGYIKQGFDETVGKAAAWGDAMGDLATKTGMTVEQSSTMAVVFENVGLSMETLEAAAKSSAKNGIEFNMQALKAAAAEYQALPEGAARAQFAMERFGRAGMEMTEILSRTSENLDQLGTSAVNTGRVIDEKAAAAAERMAMRTKELEGRVEGLKITLGNAAIPVILDTWDAFDKLNTQLGAGEIGLSDYLAGMRNVATGQAALTAEIDRQKSAAVDLVHDTDRLTTSTASVIVPISELTAANKDAADSHDLVAAAAGRAALAHDNDARAASALKLGMGELTKEMIFNAASEGLSNEAKLQLALSMGMVDQAAVGVSGKIQDLKTKYDTNRDGVIDLKEATSGYLEELAKIKGTVDAIPDYQVKTVNFAVTGNINGDDVQQLVTSNANGNRNVRRAFGGPFSAGDAMIFNENPSTRPEVVVADPRGGGYVLTKQDAQAALGGGGAASITINVNGVSDPVANAREISRILAAQMRGLASAGASVLGR